MNLPPAKCDRIVNPNDLKAGDVIGFSGQSWISFFPHQHRHLRDSVLGHQSCGHHGPCPRRSAPVVESRRWRTCRVIGGDVFNGTTAHSLEKIIERYKGKVWHYPLCRPLSRMKTSD